MIFFFPLKMFPKGSVSSSSLLQRLRVNNIPQQMPLFYSVEALPSTPPPRPASPTGTTPESYLDRPGRAAKGFVKLPPVISPARRITVEPTHTHTHTLMWASTAAACCSAFIRCIHLYFSSSWGRVFPRQRREQVELPVAVTHQVQLLPLSQLWWVFIQSASVDKENVWPACNK